MLNALVRRLVVFLSEAQALDLLNLRVVEDELREVIGEEEGGYPQRDNGKKQPYQQLSDHVAKLHIAYQLVPGVHLIILSSCLRRTSAFTLGAPCAP